MKKRKNIVIQILILIILIIIVIITSFKSGQKYYYIKNTQFDNGNAIVDSNIAKWYFKATIIY